MGGDNTIFVVFVSCWKQGKFRSKIFVTTEGDENEGEIWRVRN
jgi:hypothetical protein